MGLAHSDWSTGYMMPAANIRLYLSFDYVFIFVGEFIRSLADRLCVRQEVDLNLAHPMDETLEIFIVSGEYILEFP